MLSLTENATLQINFTTCNGNKGFRTVTDVKDIDPEATHVFRELRGGKWITRARKLTGTGPYAAANYMRAVTRNGGRIELIGTV